MAAAPKTARASDQELKSREKQTCKRCGLLMKHRTNECFTNLDGLEAFDAKQAGGAAAEQAGGQVSAVEALLGLDSARRLN